ncbi:MAG: CotS family spore coat protein [Lachnospiraceae bacterium]|nr:CotS family spore coat protein [Lachnospiraceae bacterium]
MNSNHEASGAGIACFHYIMGVIELNDRAVSLFENYDLTISKTRKGRGAMIAETDKGMKILTEYQGHKEKAELLEHVMRYIKEQGFPYIDCLLRNNDGEIITTDYDGRQYVVKDFLPGRECNVKDLQECRRVVKELAKLHSCMCGLFDDYKSPVSRQNMMGEFDKKNAQLKRVRAFIRKSPVKTDFELLFLKEYDRFLKQTQTAGSCLTDEVCDALCRRVTENAVYCHGDCSHHNLLIADDHVSIINFEKCKTDTQLKDLALFLRKVLEKNAWSASFGMGILHAYGEIRPLSAEEFSYLFARLSYPEKFVKIAGSYLNQRKSLPAKRQSDKLCALLEMEEARTAFLNEYRKECLR